jgi:CubicO group peptidase (beta-lactamase class C family)
MFGFPGAKVLLSLPAFLGGSMKIIVSLGAVALLSFGTVSVAGELDRAKLELLNDALAADRIADVHAVLVDFRGNRIFEQYYEAPDEDWGTTVGVVEQTPDRKHDVRSVSKSVTALVLGMALGDDWRQDLKRTLGSLFPARIGDMGHGVASIKLEDVLTMRAGIDWNEMTEPYGDSEGNYSLLNDENRMYSTDDPLGLVIARDVVTKPGTEWYYNGGLTQILGYIVEQEADVSFETFLESRLFGPLGIEDYDWRRSSAWPSDIPPATASGLRLTAEDMAKIGQLILARGQWEGEPLVDAGWIDAMTARTVETIPWFNEDGMNCGYGYMWYRGQIGTDDLIFASGNGNQKIMIFPERELVITIQAGRYNDFSQPTEKLIAEAVLAAIPTSEK